MSSAFDTIKRSTILRLLEDAGCSEEDVRLVRLLLANTGVKVRVNSEICFAYYLLTKISVLLCQRTHFNFLMSPQRDFITFLGCLNTIERVVIEFDIVGGCITSFKIGEKRTRNQ